MTPIRHLLLAGAALALPAAAASAQTPFATLDRTATGTVTFSGGERNAPILAGGTVTVGGERFRPGQAVVLMYGATPLPGGELVADAQGKLSGRITVPQGAMAGIHPIVVMTRDPYFATVAELKVSPTVPLSGQGDYTVTQADVAKGLYQSAYSPKTNMLFVTSSTGRPPVTQSELLKLDATTMKVVARVKPEVAPAPAARPGGGGDRPRPAGGAAPAAPAGPPLFAVYGIGLDDANGNVWVTQTRQNTMAVYRQSDLSLVKQFAPGVLGHGRDVAVHAGKAYATGGAAEVAVIDARTLTPAAPIAIRSGKRGAEFSAMSLSLNAAANRLYAVGMTTDEVAVIDTAAGTVEKVLPVPGAKGSIGVSHDPQTGRIYVASQGSDTLTVLDGGTGAVIASTPVGAGALNVVFDPVKRRAFVTNRGAGTVTVTDADGKIVANLGPAPLANHVSLGRGGTVFAVDKSAGPEGESDTILKITPKR